MTNWGTCLYCSYQKVAILSLLLLHIMYEFEYGPRFMLKFFVSVVEDYREFTIGKW